MQGPRRSNCCVSPAFQLQLLYDRMVASCRIGPASRGHMHTEHVWMVAAKVASVRSHQFLNIMEIFAQKNLLPSSCRPHGQGFDTCATVPNNRLDHVCPVRGHATTLSLS